MRRNYFALLTIFDVLKSCFRANFMAPIFDNSKCICVYQMYIHIRSVKVTGKHDKTSLQNWHQSS